MIAQTVDGGHAPSSQANTSRQMFSEPAMAATYHGQQTANESVSTACPLKSALRAAAAKQIWAGFVLLLIGLAITGISMAIAPGGFFVVTYGAIAVGLVRMVGGMWKLITA